MYKMRVFMLALVAVISLGAAAQGIRKERVLSDDTRILSTTLCDYAKAGGLFGKTLKVGMSHITYPDADMTYTIIIPQTSDHYMDFPAGKRAIIKQANGRVMTLENVHNIGKSDNRRSLDNRFTIYPEYAVSAQQLKELSGSEVVKIRLETDGDTFIDIDRKDYQKQWLFNKYVQQCHNVLSWKLAELKGIYKGF